MLLILSAVTSALCVHANNDVEASLLQTRTCDDGKPGKVVSFEIYNHCPSKVHLEGWDCELESHVGCYFINETILCSQEGESSTCHGKSTRRGGDGSRIQWFFVDDDTVKQYFEISQPFLMGPGDRIGAVSFSDWQGFSMAASFRAQASQSDCTLVCEDPGGYTTYPNPTKVDGKYQCSFPKFASSKDNYLCRAPNVSSRIDAIWDNTKVYLPDPSKPQFFEKTGHITNYPCNDDCVNKLGLAGKAGALLNCNGAPFHLKIDLCKD